MTTSGVYVRFGSAFSPVDLGTKLFKANSSHVLTALCSRVVVDVAGTLLRAPIRTSALGTFKPLFDLETLAHNPSLSRASFVVTDGDNGLLFGCGTAVCRMTSAGSITTFRPIRWLANGLVADSSSHIQLHLVGT